MQRSQELGGRLLVVELDRRRRVGARIVTRVDSSWTFEARIIHTLLTKKAMHDRDNATPAATAVNRLSFALIVR